MNGEMRVNDMIERCGGISTGTGYLVGNGYSGKTKELDDIVKKEAEILQEMYGLDVQIRFNSNRESGGAWVIDGKDNCSIGLSASLRNSKIFYMTKEEMNALSLEELENLFNEEKDIIVYEIFVNYHNTINKLKESDICYGGSMWHDFENMDDAVRYLKENISGLKNKN